MSEKIYCYECGNEFRSWIGHYYTKGGKFTLYFEEEMTSVNGDIDKRDGFTILKSGHHTIDEGAFRLMDFDYLS